METATVSSTPAVSTDTPSAAPATSAPSSVAPSRERPQSDERGFEAAFAKVAATSEPVSVPVPATTAQAETLSPTGAVVPPKATPGPIPFEAHTKALENARTKAAAESLAAYRAQHGWAETVPREHVDSFQTLMRDPVTFATDLIERLRRDPAYGPQLRSHAARTLASGRTPAPVDLSPDLQVTDANGTVVSESFSAKKVQALIQHAVSEAIGREVAPLKQDAAARKAETDKARAQQQAAQTQQQIAAKVDETFSEVEEILDGDKALYADVLTTMDQHPEWTAHKAALAVRKAKIVPTLDSKAQARALDSLKQKAAGTTAHGIGAPGAPAKPRTERELAAWLAARDR